MANITGRSDSYIFDGAGGMRDQLEQAILTELERKSYPLKASIQKLKSGAVLGNFGIGTKEQCVVIDLDDGNKICISNTSVGSYLYVGIYLMTPTIGGLDSIKANYAQQIGDIFKLQKIDAYYAAALAATESAFKELGLKQSNSGYTSKSIKH